MILSIPDVRQADDYDCGWACMDAILRFYKQRERGPQTLANRVQGLAADTVEALFRALNFRVLSGTFDPGVLKHLCDSGRPVMCAITVDVTSHWVVVAGVTRRYVHYHDPLVGARKVTIGEWVEHWRDPQWDEYLRWGICPEKP